MLHTRLIDQEVRIDVTTMRAFSLDRVNFLIAGLYVPNQ